MKNHLPEPGIQAKAHSQQLSNVIKQSIRTNGPMRFSEFMHRCLYEPGLGYYVSGTHKFGQGGDFITAPEISPLFGQCVAKQCAQILSNLPGSELLEFGAGTGRLAVDVLLALENEQQLPERYLILDLSPDLRTRQYETLKSQCPHLLDKIVWCDSLPEQFNGVVLANEVLDAMPVERFRVDDDNQLLTYFVRLDDHNAFQLIAQDTSFVCDHLLEILKHAPKPYDSEINLRGHAWVQSLAQMIKTGVILLMDYGFDRRTYYHADRHMGTLMCHYRHHTHSDIFFMPGLQDITAHVDFTALAEAAVAAELSVAGYTTQAHFLINCGLLDIVDTNNVQAIQAIKQLILPTEMGELFKVMAMSKGVTDTLLGFAQNDHRMRL